MKGDKPKSQTKNPALSVTKKKSTKKEKKAKGFNKLTRPAAAFVVFLEEFKRQHKEENPNDTSDYAVGKKAKDEWKKLSHAEKLAYMPQAEERKVEREEGVEVFKKHIRAEDTKADEEEYEKSMSEVNNEVEDEDEDEDE